VIRKIYLHEDGKNVDIIMIDGTHMIAPINSIQRVSEGSELKVN